MPVADAAATSWFDTPARFARSGSTCSFTTKFSAPQSSRVRSACGVDRLAGLELPDVDARPRDGGRQLPLQHRQQVPRVVLVADLQDHLRVVELLQLRRDRGPEARPAAADEGGQRLQDVARLAVPAG